MLLFDYILDIWELYGEVSSLSFIYLSGSQGTLAYLNVYVCKCLRCDQYTNALLQLRWCSGSTLVRQTSGPRFESWSEQFIYILISVLLYSLYNAIL